MAMTESDRKRNLYRVRMTLCVERESTYGWLEEVNIERKEIVPQGVDPKVFARENLALDLDRDLDRAFQGRTFEVNDVARVAQTEARTTNVTK